MSQNVPLKLRDSIERKIKFMEFKLSLMELKLKLDELENKNKPIP